MSNQIGSGAISDAQFCGVAALPAIAYALHDLVFQLPDNEQARGDAGTHLCIVTD
jgi:hypothetical protein